MASYLVQAGTSVYIVSQSGTMATQVTLPSGITLYGSTQPIRAVVFNSGAQPYIVCVNGANHDFFIDQTGTAYKLQLSAPASAPALAVGNTTGLTGIYIAAVTYKIKDANGVTVYESAL